MLYGWEGFAETVKYRHRYFFSDQGLDTDDPDYMAPGALLVAIGDALRDGGLVRPLADEPIYRVRTHGSRERPRTAAELGAPPAACIGRSSRMSLRESRSSMARSTRPLRPPRPARPTRTQRPGRWGRSTRAARHASSISLHHQRCRACTTLAPAPPP